MALFGLFGKKEAAAEARKLQPKATAKFGPSENRMKALEELRELHAPEGYAAMLQRFTVRVEPGQTDDEEKDYVCNTLIDVGEAAIGPIKQFIEKGEFPAWGLRALGGLVSRAEVVETILLALEREGPDYTRDPEKKVSLLRHLDPIEDDAVVARVVPFFADTSEDVRFSAIAAATHHPVEVAREPLIRALLTAHEEKSERMRRHAASALVRTGLDVKGHTPAVQAALPPGFTIDKDGIVKGPKEKA